MKYIYVIALVIVFSSCKKDWVCECSNSNGVYNAGEITATKKKAEEHCKSLSTTATNCYLK